MRKHKNIKTENQRMDFNCPVLLEYISMVVMMMIVCSVCHVFFALGWGLLFLFPWEEFF